MKPNRLVLLCFLLAIGLAGSNAYASTVVLNDWCFNVNGSIAVCNGGSLPVGSFDTSLTPTVNALGTATFTLGPGNGQYVLAYMDYDINYATVGSFRDFGVVGTIPLGVSYELDDPNTSNIFSHFQTNGLLNTNNVATPLLPGDPSGNGPCCDVSWALGFGGIDVPAGGTATVTFKVSPTNTGGFLLQQTNDDNQESIYLTGSVVQGGGGPAPIPEPGTLVLLSTGFIALFGAQRFRRSRNS